MPGPSTPVADSATPPKTSVTAGTDSTDCLLLGPPLAYPGLGSVEVRIAGGTVVRIEGRALSDPPAPIADRPGSGGKDDLDLSTVLTSDGLLGGSPFPTRVDAILVPGDSGISRLPDLAGRLGLEAIGLTVPLVQTAASVERPESRPTMVLAGTGNRLTQELADSGRIDLAALAPGEGLIQLVPEAFGSKASLVVTGVRRRRRDACPGAGRADLSEPGGARRRPSDRRRRRAGAVGCTWPDIRPSARPRSGFTSSTGSPSSSARPRAGLGEVLMSVERADPGSGDLCALPGV